ncbi:hypothetical protein MOQ_004128 [Trypanosoma cruzi marinkellei]|uniref:Uncharacterized protein n=1 Tax=Trypanosoma cruzi marinkellei TaxID=85056 RepID=K2NAY2_TRYCR|nr:hypothetical protein MOQ_004128 [Trypanosoma cruzi marinkellei]
MAEELLGTFNARLVTTPFGINGLERYTGPLNVKTARLIQPLHLSKPVVAAGTRGVQKLAAKERQDASDKEKPLVMISLHHKGKLLVWDADTVQTLAICSHHACSVVQCVVTATYLYVRVEKEGEDTDVEKRVYVWDAETFELLRRLSSHDERVTSIAVSDEDDAKVATASVDNFVHVWDLNKSLTGPIQRLATNGMAVVSLYFHGMILGSSSHTSLILWKAETGESLLKHKEVGGTITVLRRLYDSKCKSDKNAHQSHRSLSLLIGHDDGFIKEWALDTNTNSMMTLKWESKAHKAYVTDVTGDGDVVLSCSTLDGAFLLLPSRGRVAPLVSYGSRIVVLDSNSKLAIVGVDNGSIRIFSYFDFLEGQGKPVLISSFSPHTSGVTGLLLQLREDSTWDSIMCSGADGSLIFMDFTGARGGQWIKGVSAHSVDALPNGNLILAPVESGGGICLFSSIDLLPLPQEPELRTSYTVTAIRYVEPMRLLVGCENGSLMIFQCAMDASQNISFHKLEEREVPPYLARSFSPSQPDGELAAVNLQKGILAQEGAFLVIDTKQAELMFPIRPLTHIYPFRSSIFTFTGSEKYDYTVILQLRDGTMVQYLGNLAKKTMPVFVRTLVGSLLADVLQGESAGFLMYPSNYILDLVHTASGKVKLSLIYADGAALKQLFFGIDPESMVETRIFCDRDVLNASMSMHPTGDEVLTMEPIGHADLGVAVIRDSPIVDIISNDGNYLYRILYTGSVSEYQAALRQRRSRSFPYDASSLNNSISFAPASSSAACTASFCAEGYYLAIGYRDGLIQLFDTTRRVVFARLTVHNAMINSLWSFSGVVISSSTNGSLYASVVFPRVMFDDYGNSSISSAEGSIMRRTSVSISVVPPN